MCAACLSLLQLEKAQKSPARVQLLFERVVASFPVTSQLWLQYGRYLESEIKVHDVINKVRLTNPLAHNRPQHFHNFAALTCVFDLGKKT